MPLPQFKVIKPFDVAAAEEALVKANRRKRQSKELDDYLTRDHRKYPWAKDKSGMYPDPKQYFAKGMNFVTSDTKIDDDNIVYARKFPSSKGVADKYEVRVDALGRLSCNCMGWSVKKHAHRHCPHCDELINDLHIHMRTK